MSQFYIIRQVQPDGRSIVFDNEGSELPETLSDAVNMYLKIDDAPGSDWIVEWYEVGAYAVDVTGPVSQLAADIMAARDNDDERAAHEASERHGWEMV